jgi:chemotaxis protein MotB
LLSCSQSPAKPDETAALIAENQSLSNQIDVLNEKIMSLTASKESIESNALTYSNLVKDLRDQLTTKETTVKELEDSVRVTFVSDIFFDEGSDVIKPEGIKALDAIAATLSSVKDREIRVEGYTDDVPIAPKHQWKFPSNWELSTARAGAVVRHLVDKGVKPEILKSAGYSKYNPVASNDTPEGRSKNRRIVIELVRLDARARYK